VSEKTFKYLPSWCDCDQPEYCVRKQHIRDMIVGHELLQICAKCYTWLQQACAKYNP